MVSREKWLRFACLFICIVALPCWTQSDAANEWRRQIFVKLSLHKHFPFEACGKSGEAKVDFTIDRAGKLISTNIVRGTGVPALDEAALQMVKSAQPFPPAPSDVVDSDLTLTAPVIFHSVSTALCEAERSEKRLPSVTRSSCRGC